MRQKQILGIVLIVTGTMTVFAISGVLFMMVYAAPIANFTSGYPVALAFVFFGLVLIATGVYWYRQEE